MGALTDPSSIALDLDPRAARLRRCRGAARATPRGWDFLGSVPVPAAHRMRDERRATSCSAMCAAGRRAAEMLHADGAGRPHAVRAAALRPRAGRFSRNCWSRPNMATPSTARFHAAHVEPGAFAGCQPARRGVGFADCGPDRSAGLDRRLRRRAFRAADRPQAARTERRSRDAGPISPTPSIAAKCVFGGWRREGARQWSERQPVLPALDAAPARPDGLARIVRQCAGADAFGANAAPRRRRRVARRDLCPALVARRSLPAPRRTPRWSGRAKARWPIRSG